MAIQSELDREGDISENKTRHCSSQLEDFRRCRLCQGSRSWVIRVESVLDFNFVCGLIEIDVVERGTI